MPFPASNSADPRSIFAKKTNLSIASSSVALAGNFSMASRTLSLALLPDMDTSHGTPIGAEVRIPEIVNAKAPGRAHE